MMDEERTAEEREAERRRKVYNPDLKPFNREELLARVAEAKKAVVRDWLVQRYGADMVSDIMVTAVLLALDGEVDHE